MTDESDEITRLRRLKAPSLAEMEVMAEAAFARLPRRFRAMCGNLVIRVEDFPEPEVLDEMEAETEFDLLGLFRGIGLAQGGDAVPFAMPNMIHLYRRPILDYWAEHDEMLGRLVTHVLIHEIGHHFGLSDDDMERVETEAGGN
ncbi:metallopeptidase family protein [Ancylobacter sp. 6x-1]|uniref:Metallopeptidase family protein n=1 Tax=Ancylobacter crimeensis TaxID=2579147 RepID=A0ABT0DEW7_9HYPH|nr:metallopeptidase family protein [Ancylobacter crimeensis]MCK0198439.1 metallopeptidase family protein [Ancylobacter crimeensis]